MSTGQQTGVPAASSKQLEQYQQGLCDQVAHHELIVAGLAEIADSINGLAELPIPTGLINDNINIFIDGAGKILQGFTNLRTTVIDALHAEIAALGPIIEQVKAQETGIVIARPMKVTKGN